MADPALPRDVLDAHVSLFRHAQTRAPALLTAIDAQRMTYRAAVGDFVVSAFGEAEETRAPGPADTICGWLAGMLFDARTYQVTPEMCDLARQLTGRGLDADAGFTVDERELPHPWGFIWLDEKYSSDSDLEIPFVSARAIAWGMSNAGTAITGPEGDTRDVGQNVKVLMFDDDPSTPGCPLVPSWAGMLEIGREWSAEPVARFLVMLWRLLDMEITSIRPQVSGDRQLDKQARRSIRHDQINVVSLRRPEHATRPGERREVKWSCAWIVRGHMRRYREPIRTGPNAGKTQVWIKPYIKGPDGAPLKASEILYLLRQ